MIGAAALDSTAAFAARVVRVPRRPGRRALTVIALLAGLAAGGWLWLRDSSLVSVSRVTIVGVNGPGTAHIRAALADAARTMTTLHVRVDALRTAVSPYPVVKDLRVSAHPPHGLTIRVIEEVPVATIVAAGQRIAVAGDRTLLRAGSLDAGLPTITLPLPPGGTRLTDGAGLRLLAVLAAAPGALRSRIVRAFSTRAHGLTTLLGGGTQLWFGDDSRLTAKWAAAVRILADPGSAGAAYIDLWVPERPAVGGLGNGATAAADSSATAPSVSAGSSTAATSGG